MGAPGEENTPGMSAQRGPSGKRVGRGWHKLCAARAMVSVQPEPRSGAERCEAPTQREPDSRWLGRLSFDVARAGVVDQSASLGVESAAWLE